MKRGKPEWVEENERRVRYQNLLYHLDGRDSKSHPKHGRTSGLHQEILIYKKVKKALEIHEKWKHKYWRIPND